MSNSPNKSEILRWFLQYNGGVEGLIYLLGKQQNAETFIYELMLSVGEGDLDQFMFNGVNQKFKSLKEFLLFLEDLMIYIISNIDILKKVEGEEFLRKASHYLNNISN